MSNELNHTKLKSRILSALENLPERTYVKMGHEIAEDGEDEGRKFMYAGVHVEPPDGGWVTRGDYFGHPSDWPDHKEPCPEHWKFDDRASVAITSVPGDKRFWSLLANMLEEYNAKHAKESGE